MISGDGFSWTQAIVLAITISGVHEASRFSLDARKPTRLGAGLLVRTSLGSLAGAGVAIVAGLIALRFLDDEPSVLWIPVALAVISLPLFAARLFEVIVPRLSRRPQGPPAPVMLGVSAFAAVAVVVVVTVAAQQRAIDRRSDVVPRDTPTPLDPSELSELYPEQISGGLATLFGLFLVAAVLGLLYGALNRRQLLLVQDDIELDLDDSRFAFSLPDPAELEDVGLDIGRTVELIDALLVDLDTETDPGRAIRFAYARVEQQLAAVDLAPGESETAQEFLHRALPALGDGTGLRRLTDVFEQARFATVAVTEDHRAGARDALQSLQGQLQVLTRRHLEERSAQGADEAADGGARRPGVRP
jgi:hypothetical protein